MFEALAALLGLAGVVTVLVGIVLLFFPRRVSRGRALLLVASGFSTFLVMGSLLPPAPTAPTARRRPSAAQPARPDPLAPNIVQVVCEAEMTRRLRAPRTADYPFGHVANVEPLSATRYRLRSYVDAENGFGGEVRTRFVCVVEGTGNKISGYRVSDFTVLD